MFIKIQLEAWLLLLLAAAVPNVSAYKDYNNYHIYNILPQNEAQLNELLLLSQNREYDFLSLHKRVNSAARVMVASEHAATLLSVLEQKGIFHSLLTSNVGQNMQRKTAVNRLNRSLNVFEDFYEYDEIYKYIGDLSKQHASRVFVKQFGRSYENRPMHTVTITNGDGRVGKNVILVDAAVHAREWITPSMALHLINELVLNFSENAYLLQDYDWVIVPVVNVDGYAFTHAEDRLWRKTRKPNEGHPDCVGTDPNRNFGHYWGINEGSSADPCEEIYRGTHAFSEPETQVLRDVMLHYAQRIKFYLSLHSFGNYMLLPWGYTSELPATFFDMMDVADAGAMAIVLSTNTEYRYGATYNTLYATSGDSTDYAVGVVKIPIAITLEMPAGGWSGFDPPARQIEEIVQETWIGVKAMAEVVIDKY